MNKTLLIFRHELVTTLKRTGFIVMTLALPVLGILGIIIGQIISNSVIPSTPEISNIGYIDQSGGFDQFTNQGIIQFQAYTSKEAALLAMVNKDIKEYFVIPADYAEKGSIDRYVLEKQPAPPESIVTAMKNFLTSNLLSGKVASSTISVIERPLNVGSIRLQPDGEIASDQGGFGSLVIPGVFAMLLILSLSFSSAYLLQSMGEEKENRLIEVLLSSVTTRQLLVGKVLGLGIAGLVQVAVWLISFPVLLKMGGSTFGGFFNSIQLPPNFIILGIVYFILGYAIFAVLSAITGAISASAREGQQLASIYTMISVSPLWFVSAMMIFPDSAAWVALTIFPLTAPVVTMIRLGLTGVPAWQLATSILVMIVCTLGLLLFSVRILRTYLLVYGKRPNLNQIWKILRSG
jgi:ABC-2 type transport system permease protein